MNRQIVNYLVLGIGVLSLLYVYFSFAYAPLHKRLRDNRQVLAARQQAVAAAQDMVANYDELTVRAARLNADLEELEERIPAKPHVPLILKDVTRAATECNIKDLQFAPQPLVNKEDYAIQPIKIKITGNYHALGLFISKLAARSRLMNAKELQINGRDKTGTTSSISAEMMVETYVRSNP